MKNLGKAVLALSLLCSVTVLAQSKTGTKNASGYDKAKPLVDRVSGQGYGMAGCGLGSVVFGDKPGIVQIFATTTNGVSGNQTFAISSGTLNCGAKSGRSAEASAFIEMNKVAIENEVARGPGEALASLQQVTDCQGESFSSNFRKNYLQAFPQGGASIDQIHAVALGTCQN